MNNKKLLDYCMSKEGAYLDFPFVGEGYAVVKIKNEKTDKSRIFAEIFVLKDEEMLTFGSESEVAIILREKYPDKIKRGYHCPPVQAKFKSSLKTKDFDDESLQKFVDLSYSYAKMKLKLN